MIAIIIVSAFIALTLALIVENKSFRQKQRQENIERLLKRFKDRP